MSWIEDIKSSVTVPQVAGWLQMKGRLRSLGPCPSCSATQRSRSDGRGPVGVNSKGDGWECHACGSKGDAVELACQGVLGASSNDLEADGWKQLREWFSTQGVDTSHSANPGQKSRRAPTRSVGSMVSSIVGSDRESRSPTERKRVKPTDGVSNATYGWQPDLIERCEAALWEDTAEALDAREYLTVVRKLSEESLREFRIGLYCKSGSKPTRVSGRPVIVIPLIDDTEEPVSAKFRSVPTPGTCEHCNDLKGCRKCRDYRNCKDRPLPLFGSHRLSNDLAVPVIMVEGEFDVLAAYTYGLKVNVVSTTAGAGSFAEEWYDLLEPYESIIGLYDDDEKGDLGFAEVASKLGEYRCSRARPPGAKDLGDCLMADVDEERVLRCLGRADPMHGIAMKKADDYADAIEILINEPWRLRGVTTGWDNLDDVIAGWRPGVVVITGETGQGKTTFATAACLNLARADAGVMLTSFEQEPIGTVQKLLRSEIGGDFTHVEVDTRRNALAALGELPLWILDHYGHITPAKLVETMRYAKRRHGVTFFLVDHLGFLIDPEAKDERRAIESVIRALAIVAKQMQITIFLVAHPHNTGTDHKGRPNEVTSRHLKGASAIRQDADDIIVVSQIAPSKETPWPRSKIKADKVRSDFGVSGGVAILAFDPGSNQFGDEWTDTSAGQDGLLVPRKRNS